MTLIDTHCHLNFDRYDEDRDALMGRAADAGVTRVIIPAIDLDTSRQALDLSQQYDSIYVAVGLHPNSTANFDESILPEIEALAAEPKVIAIGEIGLDYHWDHSPPQMQKRAFQAQLELAARLALPVIIHNRKAGEDVVAMLEDWVKNLPDTLKARPGVMHSFSDSPEVARRALDAGFYLGFTGPLTFKKADDLREIARSAPLDRVLVETDGPFLTPEPYRGKRNEPAYVAYVADRLAALHGKTTEEIGQVTTENAQRLFGLDV